MNSKNKLVRKLPVSQPKPPVGSVNAGGARKLLNNEVSSAGGRINSAAVAASSLSRRVKPATTASSTTNSPGQKASNNLITSRPAKVITALKSSSSIKDVEERKESSKNGTTKPKPLIKGLPGLHPVLQRGLSKAVIPVKQSPSRGVKANGATRNDNRKSLTLRVPSPGGARRSLTRGVSAIRKSLTRASPIPVGLSSSPLPKPTRVTATVTVKGIEVTEKQALVDDTDIKKDELEEANNTISQLRMRVKDLEIQLTTNAIKTKLDHAMKRIRDLELEKEILQQEMESLIVKHQLEMDATVQDCATVIKCGVSFWDESKAKCEELTRKNSELQAQLDRLLLESGTSRKDQKLAELRKASGGVSVRNALLKWCQSCVKDYPDVEITNFSSSWADGKAFCVLLHSLDPTLIDMEKVDGSSSLEKFEVVVEAAKKLGVGMDLDIKSIVNSGDPSWELIMTYVSEIYAAFSN